MICHTRNQMASTSHTIGTRYSSTHCFRKVLGSLGLGFALFVTTMSFTVNSAQAQMNDPAFDALLRDTRQLLGIAQSYVDMAPQMPGYGTGSLEREAFWDFMHGQGEAINGLWNSGHQCAWGNGTACRQFEELSEQTQQLLQMLRPLEGLTQSGQIRNSVRDQEIYMQIFKDAMEGLGGR